MPEASPARPVTAQILHVDPRHAQADDLAEGAAARPFVTIGAAVARAQPGDTVLIQTGIYREHVAPARSGSADRPITIQAAPGAQVCIRGSECYVGPWQPAPGLPDTVLRADLGVFVFLDGNPYTEQAGSLPGWKCQGQVFIDGQPLTEVDSADEVAALPGTWRSERDGRWVQVHFPSGAIPGAATCEITVRRRVLVPAQRGLGWLVLRGLTCEHAATRSSGGFWEPTGSQMGMVSCRAGHHWTIEGCTIRHAKTIGLDIGNEGGADRVGEAELAHTAVGQHRIRNNSICDNGEVGICGLGHTGTRIEYNRIERNNCLGHHSVEEAGIKLHFCFDGIIEGNLVRSNQGCGIWLDNVWYGTRVSRNVVLDNYNSGIFVELGDGRCLVEHNIVAYTRAGDGIYTHDSSGVVVAHNLLYCNAHFGVYMRYVSERSTQGESGADIHVGCSRQQVLNNIFVDNYRGALSLPLPNERAQDNRTDWNLFVGGTQWQWEGHFNRFSIGGNDKRIPGAEIAAAVQQACAAAGVPAPDATIFPEHAFLDLDGWRIAMGQDRNSLCPAVHQGAVENGAVRKGSCTLTTGGPMLTFNNPATFNSLRCPPVPGCNRDFRGRVLPTQHVRPGPFQDYNADGATHQPLWPVAPAAEARG